jgi:hypothetical protein
MLHIGRITGYQIEGARYTPQKVADRGGKHSAEKGTGVELRHLQCPGRDIGDRYLQFRQFELEGDGDTARTGAGVMYPQRPFSTRQKPEGLLDQDLRIRTGNQYPGVDVEIEPPELLAVSYVGYRFPFQSAFEELVEEGRGYFRYRVGQGGQNALLRDPRRVSEKNQSIQIGGFVFFESLLRPQQGFTKGHTCSFGLRRRYS